MKSASEPVSEPLVYRVYTLTIKPTYTPFKNNAKLLLEALLKYNKVVKTNSFKFVYEGKHNNNLHIHALIECPYIQNKKQVSEVLFGFHLHSKIIRKEDMNDNAINNIWHFYTSKEMTSDSERYHHLYGNMFIDQVE